jgi:hypothetical protein
MQPAVLTNVTAERVRVERVAERSSAKGEFRLEGLPDLGPFETSKLEAHLTPKGTGTRQASFDLIDDHGQFAGEVFASAIVTPNASEPEACVLPERVTDGPEQEADDAVWPALDPYQRGVCATMEGASRSPNALQGISLYLLLDKKKLAVGIRAYGTNVIGPQQAGPYRLIPWVDEFEGVVFFFAQHVERNQIEWVIGPDEIDGFASSVDIYVGAANRSLPGSARVADSQRGGATDASNPRSVVERAAFGEAPWQSAGDLLDGLDATNGGAALLGARNANIRVENYIKPAKQIADQLAKDVKEGKIAHVDARRDAVEGRNRLLHEARGRMSPSARYVSKKMKDDGPTVEQMTTKKTSELLAQYRGYADSKLEKKLGPEELTRLRARLDADTELWAKHAAAIDAADAHLRRAPMEAALSELGGSPEVSMEIIKSSGKTNRWVSRGARWGRGLGMATGVLGAADFAFDVVDEIEAKNWHALAGELGGFAGGIVGSELGAMFVASLIPGAGGAVVLFVSLIGGVIGSAIGGSEGRGAAASIVEALEDGAMGAGFGPATAASHRGGPAGLFDSRAANGKPVAERLANAIFAMDEHLGNISHDIPIARNRDELESLQRERLVLLHQRRELEDYLTAIKLGAFDEASTVPDRDPPPPPPERHGDCEPIDDDCDWRTD